MILENLFYYCIVGMLLSLAKCNCRSAMSVSWHSIAYYSVFCCIRYTEVTYQSSDAGVINPDRGGAVLSITRSSAHVPLTVCIHHTFTSYYVNPRRHYGTLLNPSLGLSRAHFVFSHFHFQSYQLNFNL